MTNVDIALTIVRSVDAPREIVWSAWTGPEELAGWWWPERFHTTYQVDLREGGAYRFRTIDVAGMGVLAVTGQFETFEPPEFLVYTWRWEGSDDLESRVTVEFRDLAGRTELHIRHEGLPTAEERVNHAKGWNDCLDRLEGYSHSGEWTG